jgi:predicted unusual protein kinase regulating ubiquinone biosynthesis (AarF/ABC1/UbiB family)
MEWMEGIKITHIDSLTSEGINPTEVTVKLVTTYYKQMLVDRLFHADPHPGNILVRRGPKLVFLDFGAVGEVTEDLQVGMRMIVLGYIMRSEEMVLDGVKRMGFFSSDGSPELLEKTVRSWFKTIINLDIKDYSRLDIRDLTKKCDIASFFKNFRELSKSFAYPKNYFLIEKTLVVLFGLCATLDPKVNALELGFPYFQKFIMPNIEELFSDAGGI